MLSLAENRRLSNPFNSIGLPSFFFYHYFLETSLKQFGSVRVIFIRGVVTRLFIKLTVTIFYNGSKCFINSE